MKTTFTKDCTLLVFILWITYTANAENPIQINLHQYSLPVDSPKKEIAPQAPPEQLITFPVSSITAKMTLNGYSQVRYQYNFDDKDPHSNSFDIRNARLILRGTVLKNIGYNFQCDFAPPTVRLLDASMSYTFNKFAKITAGQQKAPLSYESLKTDYDIHSISRSQVVEALAARSKDVLATAYSTTVVNNNGRDIGVLFSGGVPKNSENTTWVDYSFGVFDGMGINVSDRDAFKDIAARAVVHPIKTLSIGGSFYNGKATYGTDQTKPKDRNRYGFDVAYEDGKRIYAAAEYLHGVDSTTQKGGYYALVEGFILPKKFSVLVKYDFYDPNENNSEDASTITSFALNYYFASFTKIQIQYDLRHENTDTQKKNDLLSIQGQIFF